MPDRNVENVVSGHTDIYKISCSFMTKCSYKWIFNYFINVYFVINADGDIYGLFPSSVSVTALSASVFEALSSNHIIKMIN